MNAEYKNIINHGYIISRIHTMATTLFKKEDYRNLLHSTNLDDLLAKLHQTAYRRFFTEGIKRTKTEFKRKLSESFKFEFTEIFKESSDELKILLNFIKQEYQISSFIYVLISKNAVKKEEIGYFVELNTFQFAKKFSEIFQLLRENKHFLFFLLAKMNIPEDLENLDGDHLLTQLRKYHLEYFYTEKLKSIKNKDMLKRILRYMGDRQIIEVALNDSFLNYNKDNRMELFSTINNFSYKILNSLSNINSFNDLISTLSNTQYKKLSSSTDEKCFFRELNLIELEIFSDAFNTFNDLSVIYVYLKNKEQEIKNILWIVDCILLGKKNDDEIFFMK